MKLMNLLRKAVKTFSLDLLYYDIFKYLPMSLIVVNLVASCNLEKQYAKKCSQNFDKILKNFSKLFFLTLLKINTFKGIFQGFC